MNAATPVDLSSDSLHWDLFCRVVDNHGDAGVAWRLAADLASRGHRVRLWIDDHRALAWMAPTGAAGVEVLRWTNPPPDRAPGDVVVETFGCDPPASFLRRMADAPVPPVWIDLEYLSAEPYVERSHGLPSPVQVAPGRWLTRRFFYPGFTDRTGGLLREPGLLDARRAFDRAAWLAEQGIAPQPGERLVSLFCYDNPALPVLLDTLAAAPTLLLLTPGPATAQGHALLGPDLARGALRAQALPWLTQPGYDRLLWACDLNFVRGEDSFVRAQWAGAPFVWQIYPQDDDAHAVKLAALLDRMLGDAGPGLAARVRALWAAWNRLGPWPAALPEPGAWTALAHRWGSYLEAQPDLTMQLLATVAAVARSARPADD